MSSYTPLEVQSSTPYITGLRRWIGRVRRVETHYRRMDYVQLPDENGQHIDPLWCTGPNDITPAYCGYDSRCGMCYLGSGHTVAYHEREVDA